MFLSRLILCCSAIFLLSDALSIASSQIIIDVDVYDNLSEPQYFGADIYGPDEIAEFFRNCASSGVSTVYWRSYCQIASYKSKLNYSLADELNIRSYPDSRHYEGSFAVKIGATGSSNGIFQVVKCAEQKRCKLTAYVCPNKASEVFVRVSNLNTGKTIAESSCVRGDGVQVYFVNMDFCIDSDIKVGFYGSDNKSLNIFVVDDVVLQDESGDDLLKNGNMEKVQDLLPENWRSTSGLNFMVLCGDVLAMSSKRAKTEFGGLKYWLPMRSGGWVRCRNNRIAAMKEYDPLKVAVKEAHKNGVKIYAWLDPLDDGRRVPPNCAGWWVSRFHEDHPEYRLIDEKGGRRWGQLCFGYKAVREYKNDIIREVLSYGVDGIYLKQAFQHNTIWDAKGHNYTQYVYNDVALAEYDNRWGKPEDRKYDESRLRTIYGEFYLQWLREASEIVRAQDKKLVYSMAPGKYYANAQGGYPNFWHNIVKDKLVDYFLIEPRINTSVRKVLPILEKEYGFITRCHEAGIEVGFDFYLNALAEKRMRPASILEKPHAFFIDELKYLLQQPLDFVGVYEGMYVDHDNYWNDLNIVSTLKISQNHNINYYNAQADENTQKHVDLNAIGASAAISVNDKKNINATAVIDGDVTAGSSVVVEHGSFDINITLPGKTRISMIRIYPGDVSYSGNPSGECGISSYSIVGKLDGKIIELSSPEENALTVSAMGAVTDFDFRYDHQIDPPVQVDSICVHVYKSSDTGKRAYSSGKVCVPENERVTIIREIVIYSPRKEK